MLISAGFTLLGPKARPAGFRAFAAEILIVRTRAPPVVSSKSVLAGLPTMYRLPLMVLKVMPSGSIQSQARRIEMSHLIIPVWRYTIEDTVRAGSNPVHLPYLRHPRRRGRLPFGS